MVPTGAASPSGSGQPALGGGPETDPERLLPDAGQSTASTSAGSRSLEEVAAFLRDELPKTWKDGVCRLSSYLALHSCECECLPQAHQSQMSPPGLNHEASQAAKVQKLKHQSGVC